MPSRTASSSTGVGCSFMPRPAGLAARVYTATISWPWPERASSVGTAKSGVPMKIRRRGIGNADRFWSAKPALLRGPLGRLGEFFQHAVALQLREIIHEQHAVEMIDLVLNAGGEQALGILLVQLAVEIGEADPHPRRSLDFLVVFRNRQAAFLIDRKLF